ncbi:GUN4 domain-containing protein [Nostoc sp. UIC 10607]|uniref:GUN4 domain-containing protein n=1 Tax=Nostoc sp. UIC 10607 TaxID=3045935 RepID=UPI0039A34A6E
MSTDINSSIVRIYSINGKVVSAGFLVSQKYILTCAHVVADALGIDRDTAEMPNAEVSLDFPLLGAKQLFTARIVFWLRANPNEEVGDIAALELASSPPNAQPAKLIAEENLWDHRFRVFGFPKHKSEGVWSEGEIKGKVGKSKVQIESVKEHGYTLEPGFSGAPIWDKEKEVNGVVGMAVTAERNRPEVKAAFFIPTQVLVQVTGWPVIPYTLLPYSSLPSTKADYTQLHDLLKNQKFKEADEETFKKLLWLAQRENKGWLRETDILNLPQKDLHTIDQLWLASSNGKFGFSIQKQIWNDIGGSTEINYLENVEYFFSKLNWIGDDMRLNHPKSDLNSSIKGSFPQKYLAKEIIQYVLTNKAKDIRELYKTLKRKIRNLRIFDIIKIYIEEGEYLENCVWTLSELEINFKEKIENDDLSHRARSSSFMFPKMLGKSKYDLEWISDIKKEFKLIQKISTIKRIEDNINKLDKEILEKFDRAFLFNAILTGKKREDREEIKEWKSKKSKEEEERKRIEKEIENLLTENWLNYGEEEKEELREMKEAEAKGTEGRGRIGMFLNRIEF